MLRVIVILLLSTLGGTYCLHYLKNFFLVERSKLRLDPDGLIERLLITYIITMDISHGVVLIVLIIFLKALLRLFLLGKSSGAIARREPGTASQKVLYKAELAFDLITSPAFAILVGVIF